MDFWTCGDLFRSCWLVRPARPAQERERAEDRAADHEVHGQQTELAVGRDVARDAVTDAASGHQADDQGDHEVREDNAGDDDPALHHRPSVSSWPDLP